MIYQIAQWVGIFVIAACILNSFGMSGPISVLSQKWTGYIMIAVLVVSFVGIGTVQRMINQALSAF